MISSGLKKTTIFLFILLICKSFSYSQTERGNLFLRNYLPKQYKGHAQSWVLTSDNRGVLYFGNGDGILEYDGVSWRLFPLPNKSTVRSIAKDSSGRIFVGGAGEFGYIEHDINGKFQFINLSDKLDKKDKQFLRVWSIRFVDGAAYFFTDNKIFRYKNNFFKIWNTKLKNTKDAFVFNNQIYFRQENLGLVTIINDSIQPVIFHDFCKNKEISFAINYNKKILIGLQQTGLFIYDPNEKNDKSKAIYQIKTSIDEDIKKHRFYSGNKLSDNIFAISLTDIGCLLTDSNFNVIQKIDKSIGLRNEAVWGTMLDHQKGLWITTNNGICYVDVLSPFTYWDLNLHSFGIVEAVIRHNGVIYICSHQGCFYIDKNQIKKIPGIDTQTWTFIEYQNPDNPSETHLLVGATSGIYEIVDFKYVPINKSSSTIYEFLKSAKNKYQIHVCLDDGFGSLIFKNGKFVYEGNYQGIKDNVRSVGEDKNGELWLGTFRNGIIRVTPTNGINNPKIKYYKENAGVQSLKNVLAFKFKDYIVFGTEKGLIKYDEHNDRFVPVTNFGLRYSDGSKDVFWFCETKKGDVWISGLKNNLSEIGIEKLNKDGSYNWFYQPFKIIPEMMVLGFYAEENGITWFGGSEGLFRYDGSQSTNFETKFNTLVRKVVIGRDSILFYGNFTEEKNGNKIITAQQPKERIPVIHYSYNSITFHYAACSYFNEAENQYQYYLEGYEKSWSEWSNLTFKEYTNLSEGNYKFHVRAKNNFDVISDDAIYEFSITAPWFRTFWAYLLYVVVFSAIIYFAIQINSRRLAAANRKLEQIVLERTAEIRKQNEEILFKNTEITHQKEELQTQAEELERINQMLEKLSIVASETDNAVIIMEKNGDFEWVNDGFTKLYGYTFADLKELIGTNILNSSTNPNIREAITECFEQKKSVIYESHMTTKDGLMLWVQTTLTPIIDEDGNLKKLIAIDSDISELKRAEEAINQQKEEILAQKEALEMQNAEILAQQNLLEENNQFIELQNEQIKGSIRYALTIQQAILPSRESISKYFENFILYRPKDIVSGDFYWFSTIENNYNVNSPVSYLFAAIDCTGHGVPGAFMSMIGNRIMSEIIAQNKISDPAMILEKINSGIRLALHQDERVSNDGMDVCLCKIDKLEEKFLITYCGAKRPLFYYSFERARLEEIKGIRHSIGGVYTTRGYVPFTNQELYLNKGDIIYLTTDGYIDQNNFERKRFGTVNFLKLINTMIHKNMEEQKKILENNLETWMLSTEQRDDITVIGLKL